MPLTRQGLQNYPGGRCGRRGSTPTLFRVVLFPNLVPPDSPGAVQLHEHRCNLVPPQFEKIKFLLGKRQRITRRTRPVGPSDQNRDHAYNDLRLGANNLAVRLGV
jgi:hypothetical protein